MADLYCPSVDACNAFGIRRSGASTSDNEKYKFLKGPQFSGMKSYNYSGGKPEGIIDEVTIEFIGNKPVVIKPNNQNGIVKMEIQNPKGDEKSLYTINIAPQTTDWLRFNFNHEWNEGEGIMSKVLDTVAGLLDSASGILNTAQNATGSENPKPRRKITLDKQDTYAKTDKVSFKIPFILFSSGTDGSGNSSLDPIQQWINDVYKPLILITAWTHPKRVTGLFNIGKDKQGNPVNLDTSDTAAQQQAALNNRSPDKKSEDGGGLQEDALKFLSSYPGMRVAISEPPSYVKVKHSSGFFEYNVCAITSFTYSFEGPWVKAYSLYNDDKSKITEHSKNFMNITLPMVAKCELEIKVIEKMYADDWISMFENSPILNSSSGSKDGIVNVLKKVNSNQR